MPNQKFFSYVSWQEQVNFQWDDDEVRFVLDQHAELDFYIASSLKQQSADRHVAPLGLTTSVYIPGEGYLRIAPCTLFLFIMDKYQYTIDDL
jgi:hypothetical protein